ncbi:hypothetical protein BOH78_4282, partial [Pichia kudriavzevii]
IFPNSLFVDFRARTWLIQTKTIGYFPFNLSIITEHGTALILKNTLMFLRLATSSKTEQICSTSPLPILLAHKVIILSPSKWWAFEMSIHKVFKILPKRRSEFSLSGKNTSPILATKALQQTFKCQICCCVCGLSDDTCWWW